MSEHPSFDRAKGFVALPVEVLEIDLSPGAFRLLVELCRMANADGYCWPSLDQLSDRMGRSRAAISGYVQALREAELVQTETQKTANGYNYRLKYRVTFWQDWRASLSGKVTPKAERSIQPDERLKKTQKQSHLNQDMAKASINLDQLLKKWGRCFKGAPYPLTSQQPSLELLDATKAALTTEASKSIISVDIKDQLISIWTSLRVKIHAESLNQQTARIQSMKLTPDEFDQFRTAFPQQWKPHWRRPPTREQFEKLLVKCVKASSEQRLTLLRSYQKRWEMAQNSLRPRAEFDCVSGNKQATA